MIRKSSPLPAPDRLLQTLAVKGEAGQWSMEALLAGAGEPAMPRWLSKKYHAALISQFYYGELATRRLCDRLLLDVDDGAARRCLEWQVTDEERHAAVYRVYLARLGDITPLEPSLSDAFECALAWTGPPEAMIAAFNIVIEGEALRALEDLDGWLDCPLFRRLNAHICRDEARHLAFGRFYLMARLPRLGRAARLDIYRWLKNLWDRTGLATLDRFRAPRLVTRHRWLEAGWEKHRARLIDVGLVDGVDALRVEAASGRSRR